VCQEWTVPFVVRDATVGDAAAVQDVFHRSPLSKLDGRADLLAHPEVLTFEPTSPADRRVRVAIPAQGVGRDLLLATWDSRAPWLSGASW
jgi:hypothetical protein